MLRRWNIWMSVAALVAVSAACGSDDPPVGPDASVAPFVGKYPRGDERNVVRATLYTTLGTLAALALGGAVGILLAVVFVLFRPLEQALLPWVIASQTVPIIALVPVLLLILGNFGITIQTSLLPTALIGAYIAFFPVVVGTVKGLRSV